MSPHRLQMLALYLAAATDVGKARHVTPRGRRGPTIVAP